MEDNITITPIVLEIKCRMCNHTYLINTFKEDLDAYNNGGHAQNVFKYLSADERELIISQICGSCFDKLFSDDE